MYDTEISSQDQALCHLLFHCCLKDGRFSKEEVDVVSEILVAYGLEHNLNFTDEIRRYRSYANDITNEQHFIDHLVKVIRPANELALFSLCLDLTLSDDSLSDEEEALLSKIADALGMSQEENNVITRLMVQRRVVSTEKIC